MLEAVSKNLWLVLTLVLPGLATYGCLRLILLLDQVDAHLAEGLRALDGSAFLSTSVVFSIALLQQAIAISLEAILALIAALAHGSAPQLHALFCRRFQLAAAGKLDENGTRIVGNFFLSMNVTIGLSFLLVFFLTYQHKPVRSPIPMALAGMLVASVVTTVFRLFNAKWVVHSATEQPEPGQAQGEAGVGRTGAGQGAARARARAPKQEASGTSAAPAMTSNRR